MKIHRLNILTVQEAEQWLRDNGKTYDDIYYYNIQYINNLMGEAKKSN